jgi:hypothetical protein
MKNLYPLIAILLVANYFVLTANKKEEAPTVACPVLTEKPNYNWAPRSVGFEPLMGAAQVFLGEYNTEQEALASHEAFKRHIQECFTIYTNTGLFCNPELIQYSHVVYSKKRSTWILYANRLSMPQLAGLCSYLWQIDDSFKFDWDQTSKPGMKTDGSFIRWTNNYPNNCQVADTDILGSLPKETGPI